MKCWELQNWWHKSEARMTNVVYEMIAITLAAIILTFVCISDRPEPWILTFLWHFILLILENPPGLDSEAASIQNWSFIFLSFGNFGPKARTEPRLNFCIQATFDIDYIHIIWHIWYSPVPMSAKIFIFITLVYEVYHLQLIFKVK